jgi:hypothetical protein
VVVFLSGTVSQRIFALSVCTNIPTSGANVETFKDIYVPPEQVIDTVDLYFLKSRQRRLSLRFLSWFVLHENIQTDTHDSIEDARSALNLYKAYHDLEEQGLFDQKLEEIYKEGKAYVSPLLSEHQKFLSSPLELQASNKYGSCEYATTSITSIDSACLPRPGCTDEPIQSRTGLSHETDFCFTQCILVLQLAAIDKDIA